MKRLWGIDISGSLVFAPGAAGLGTLSFVGQTLSLEQILVVTNVTRNEIIYNFADAAAGAASYGLNTLTLDVNTSTHSASDKIQAWVYVDDAQAIDAAPQSGLAMLLTRILAAMLAPLGYRKDTQRYQARTVVESGTVTLVSTVTTCSTVTNAAQLGGLSADRLINSANWSAWADCHRSRIT